MSDEKELVEIDARVEALNQELRELNSRWEKSDFFLNIKSNPDYPDTITVIISGKGTEGKQRLEAVGSISSVLQVSRMWFDLHNNRGSSNG